MTRGHVQHAPPSSLSTDTEEKELNLGLTRVWHRSLFTCTARVRITQHFIDRLVSAELHHLVSINSPTSGKTSANVSSALLIREQQQTSSPAKIQNWRWKVRQTIWKVCASFHNSRRDFSLCLLQQKRATAVIRWSQTEEYWFTGLSDRGFASGCP